MARLLSIDLKADFGMLKKPDTNEPVYLTFNMLHKPALLGIFGAIAGFSGFKKQGIFPEYWEKLKTLKVTIAPLETDEKVFHENGNFSKTLIKYNNSTGLASHQEIKKINHGMNLMVTEQTLVSPAYRCYILFDESNPDHEALYTNLFNNQAEYIPYFGKNECTAWWDNVNEYFYSLFVPEGSFKINSLFIKEESLKDGTEKTWFAPGMEKMSSESYMYFENLPIGYLGNPLYQYEYKGFAFTNLTLKKQYQLPEEYPLLKLNNEQIIQIF